MPKETNIPKYNKAEFKEAVVSFADFKDKEKEIKGHLETLNGGIKAFLNRHELMKYEQDGIELTLRETETVKYNEILLLNYLKDKGFTNCIKTKEYVDMAEFEKHLYAGVLDKNELEKFKDKEYKQALYYKRVKNEGKND